MHMFGCSLLDVLEAWVTYHLKNCFLRKNVLKGSSDVRENWGAFTLGPHKFYSPDANCLLIRTPTNSSEILLTNAKFIFRALLDVLIDSHSSTRVANVNTLRCPSASLTDSSGSRELDTAESVTGIASNSIQCG
jgi:hypothetical protein